MESARRPPVTCALDVEAVRIVIASVADHLLTSEQLAALQRELRGVASRLELDPSPESVAASVEEAEDILVRSEKQLYEAGCEQTSELQKIIAMLSRTLQALSSGSSGSVRRLQRIEQDLENTSAVEDIAAIRSRLAVCLDYVRKEAKKEQAESVRIGALEQRFRDAQEQMSVIRSGIQGRRDAEAYLETQHPPTLHLAVFRLEHFAGIQSRYGAAAAEEVAHAFIQRRVMTLPSFERVFRWDPAIILVALNSEKAIDAIRAEVRAVMSEPLERQVQLGGRVAVLRITHAWTLFAAGGKAGAELKEEVDRFIGGV